MRFRWQDLNDSKPRKRHFHGRSWFYFGKGDRRCLAAEWVIPSMRCGVTVQRRALHLHVPLIGSVYLSDGGDWGWRELSFSIGRECVRWNIWTSTMEWSSSTPWWRNGSFYFIDFLLGRHKHSESQVEHREVLVPMPERAYKGTAVLHLGKWKRPRWPFSKQMLRATVEMNEGEQIPVMGKGENSWDCGEDAIYSQTSPAKTIEEGVAHMVESALRSRRKYGTPPRIAEQTATA